MGIILILVFFYFMVKRQYTKLLIIYIISILTIPNNDFIEYKLGLKLNNLIDFREIISLLFFILTLVDIKWGKIKISSKSIFLYLPIILVFVIGILNGYCNRTEFFLTDIRIFTTIFIMYFVTCYWVKRLDLPLSQLINYFIISGLIYSVFIILLSWFGKGLLPIMYGDYYATIWQNRVAFSNTSVLYLTIFVSFYYLITKDKIILSIISIVLSGYAILLSQSRTLIIISISMVFISIIVLMLKFLFTKRFSLKGLAIGAIFAFFIAFLLGILLINFDHIFQNTLFENIQQRFLSEGNGSFKFRQNTNSYAISSVKNKIIGDGVGKGIMFGGNTVQAFNTPFIDNAFVNIFAKFGLIGMIVFITFVIEFSFYINFIVFLKNKNIFFLLLILIIPGYLINILYLTSQFFVSPAVSLSVIFLYSLAVRENAKKQLHAK